MARPNFFAGELLAADDLNAAFADCVSVSATGTQSLASILNVPQLIADISLQAEQIICTGDLVCTSGSAITLPIGPTIERPNQPTGGMLRCNSDAATLEAYLPSGKWVSLATVDAAVTPVNPPVSMSAPTFGIATSNAIPLGWSNPHGGTAPFTFKVEFRPTGALNFTTWTQQTTGLATTVSGLLPATRYDFQLTAFNPAGSAVSDIVSTNTVGFLSGGPANLTASQPTSTTMALTWLPIAGAAYQVQYAIQGATVWTDFDGPLTSTSATVTGLTPNSNYLFHVIAKTLGSASESLVAQNATLTAATVAPNTVSGLVTSGVTTSGFTVSWQPPSAGTPPLSYRVQYQLAGTSTFADYGFAQTQTSMSLTDLNSSSGYNVRVLATNSSGTSTSIPLTVTTLTAVANPGEVKGSQSSSATPPTIVAPFIANVPNLSAISLAGIRVTDPAAIYLPGTVAITVLCTTGTVTMTDAGGNHISGSGTNVINYASTYSAVQTALASLVYTATTIGSDNVTITLIDQLVKQTAVNIAITVSEGTGQTQPPPPPGGTPSSTITATGQPSDINGTIVNRSKSFTDRIGINVRLEDPGYTKNFSFLQAAALENLISYLGSNHIRYLRHQAGTALNPAFMSQIALNTNSQFILAIDQRTNPSSYPVVSNLMVQMAQFYNNTVSAFEGVYGADAFPTVLGPTNVLPSAAQFQNTEYSVAHSVGRPLWQLTPQSPNFNATFGSPPADVGTTSLFPPFSPNGGGGGLFTTDTNGYLVNALSGARTATPNLPTAIPSFGWQSFPNGVTNTGLGLVNETTQASYLLDTLFSAYKQGVTTMVIHELLDVAPSQSIDDVGQTFGLFNANGTQKISAITFRNMMSKMIDPSTTATSFVTGRLNYTVANKPLPFGGFVNTGYQDVVFQKSDGTYLLVMWNEQILNTYGGNNAPLNVPSVPIILTFNETTKSNVQVYDPLLGVTLQNRSTVASMNISLPAYPIFVQVTF